jgi:hypothetical protein
MGEVGGKVLELGDDDVREVVGVTLTTGDQANVSLYEHLGYEVVGQATVAPELRTWGSSDRIDVGLRDTIPGIGCVATIGAPLAGARESTRPLPSQRRS